ncbi:glyoxylase-like metal-dependent hydrolase (beta-lactamase superfamily II) [Litorivivens lipolytica]|uniref:Glyoxylase-like metal-dependent hydrolase (Beta-lactamase superfamily II) n=1 Tax=Litorivivens lipolytica TaxID=1524264 RepID=A0A7W4W7G9_9GAMM|nr:MBL fold metallo-hydrolase [Litorivivens lipolytica]MBB3048735.1 glyoxylase-like metal-dependent hydrolase (beta-lactamase superfamily II) [Litorivivens lipolytica]
MIFRQLFDDQSSTYTYLLADDSRREALLIDPVVEKVEQYLQLLRELNLTLKYAIDTHTHADHITALGSLRDKTGCVTIMGEFTKADCVSQRVSDGDDITLGAIQLKALFTPGHTNESFSFYLSGGAEPCVFTGDCLLIRGSGRTDFQGGDAGKSFDSIQTLFALPDDTYVYPGHDYKGWTRSTIAEEKASNPRLAGKSRDEYIEIMNNLDLPDPKMMDIAVPANLACGQTAFRSQ